MTTVVVGAGVTGLTVADALAQKGLKVVVLEKAPVVGGLCRSYRYGPHHFDIGPHRLFSADPGLFGFFQSVLGSRANSIARESAVLMAGRYLDWPLSARSLARLPAGHLALCLRDLFISGRKSGSTIASMEEYVIHRYGRTIYDVFWRGYTRKFLGIDCSSVDPSWASLSVTRSVIDRRERPGGLFDLLKNSLFSPSSTLAFLYPEGGMSVFPELLAERARRSGARILTGRPAAAIEMADNRVRSVTAGSERFEADTLVWTAPLPELFALLAEGAPALKYLSTVLFNIEADAARRPPWQWVYVPDPDIVFSRVSFPAQFWPGAAPAGREGICVEVTCRQGDDTWQKPGALESRVAADLVRSRLIESESAIRDCHVELVGNTYPVYTIGFAKIVEEARRRLERVRNLRLAGRQALFLHDNIDETVRDALGLASSIAAGRRAECATAGAVP